MRRSAGSNTATEKPEDAVGDASPGVGYEANTGRLPSEDEGSSSVDPQGEYAGEPARQLRVLSLIKGLDIGGAEQLLLAVSSALATSSASGTTRVVGRSGVRSGQNQRSQIRPRAWPAVDTKLG